MLHSGHLAAKSLTGNGLAVAEAHYLGSGFSETPAILWYQSAERVKQPLKKHMAIWFGTSGWHAVIADEFTFAGVGKPCTLGLATDGDGDRFGLMDAYDEFITPNQLIAGLFDYLAESRSWTGGVARSEATSPLVDRVTEARGLPVYEKPVGFKFIGELINEDKIILGGEESAGLSVKGHYPEKDGILAGLLAAEAVASRRESLTQELTKFYARVGRLEVGRMGMAPGC
jgi:phosphoglucomutase